MHNQMINANLRQIKEIAKEECKTSRGRKEIERLCDNIQTLYMAEEFTKNNDTKGPKLPGGTFMA